MKGDGFLFLPKWRRRPGQPYRTSSVWWWCVPDGRGHQIKGPCRRDDGTPIRGGKPGKPPREARDVLVEKLHEVRRGLIQAGALTWDDLSRALLSDIQARGLKGLVNYRNRLRPLDEFFRGVRAEDIVGGRRPGSSGYMDWVSEFTAWRRAGHPRPASIATINFELSLFRQGFQRAVNKGRLSRMPDAPYLPGANVRKGFIEDADLRAICELMPEECAAAAWGLRYTGWRESTVIGLERANVRWDRMVIRLEPNTTKNRRPLEFPFDGYAPLRTLVERQWRRLLDLEARGVISPWLFCRADGGRLTRGAFYSQWYAARKKLGLKWTPHDIRRTWVREALPKIDLLTVMELGGWETIRMVKRYAIWDLTKRREAAAKLDAPLPEEPGRRQLVLFQARGQAQKRP